MITECAAILAVTLCMVVILLRSGHGDYSASILPIMIVPAVHLIVATVFGRIHLNIGKIPYPMAIAFADITALAIACLCVFALSAKVGSKRNRKVYLILCSGYNVILTCALISQLLAPYVEHLLGRYEGWFA